MKRAEITGMKEKYIAVIHKNMKHGKTNHKKPKTNIVCIRSKETSIVCILVHKSNEGNISPVKKLTPKNSGVKSEYHGNIFCRHTYKKYIFHVDTIKKAPGNEGKYSVVT